MEMDEEDAAQKLHINMQEDVVTCPMPAGSVLLMNAHSMPLPLVVLNPQLLPPSPPILLDRGPPPCAWIARHRLSLSSAMYASLGHDVAFS